MKIRKLPVHLQRKTNNTDRTRSIIFLVLLLNKTILKSNKHTWTNMRLRSGKINSDAPERRDLKVGKSKDGTKTKKNIPHGHDTSSILKLIALKLVKVLSVLLLVVYVAVPVIVKTNPWIQSKVIFLNNLRWPPFIDFSQPEILGLNVTRNFYLNTNDNIRLGAWHMLPSSLSSTPTAKDHFEELLHDSVPVILYLHGNSGTRAGWHRVGLYKVLSSMDYHVITFDYRGYGDSSGSPSEDGVVSDALFIYRWIKQRKGNSPLFIWGHSLGTGVTTRVARELCKNGESPDGIFLESGFNNILDAATYHPMAIPFRVLPGFNWLFLDTITENNIHFQSDVSIADVTPPVLILHAEDDVIVPYHLGEKLYAAAKQSRLDTHGGVEFVSFNASLRYGHKLIFMAPELPAIIRKFIKKCDK